MIRPLSGLTVLSITFCIGWFRPRLEPADEGTKARGNENLLHRASRVYIEKPMSVLQAGNWRTLTPATEPSVRRTAASEKAVDQGLSPGQLDSHLCRRWDLNPHAH